MRQPSVMKGALHHPGRDIGARMHDSLDNGMFLLHWVASVQKQDCAFHIAEVFIHLAVRVMWFAECESGSMNMRQQPRRVC